MPFKRHLDPDFIEALNQLYRDEKSWWRTLVKDPDVFMAIRNNVINAYAGGASIAKIEWKRGKLRLLVHRKFLVVPKSTEGSNYVDLIEAQEVPKAEEINNVFDYVKHLNLVKDVARRLTAPERRGENEIAVRCANVLDIEAAFNTDQEGLSSDEETEQGRVDIVALKDGTLTLIETKLYENQDLYSRKEPAVCEQIEGYRDWAKDSKAAIIAAYESVRVWREMLHLRSSTREVTNLNLTPRLVIFGFHRASQKERDAITEKIVNGLDKEIQDFSKTNVVIAPTSSAVECADLE